MNYWESAAYAEYDEKRERRIEKLELKLEYIEGAREEIYQELAELLDDYQSGNKTIDQDNDNEKELYQMLVKIQDYFDEEYKGGPDAL